MKILDYIVLAAFVIALVVFCFFQKCSMDIYFLILGFAVAAIAAVAMVLQNRKEAADKQE